MFTIGITGGIGTGKSAAAHVLKNWGIPVLDADAVSHQVTAVGGAAIPEIVATFGSTVISDTGELDRDAVADLVFHDRKSLDTLSFIVHRHVIATMHSDREKLIEAGKKICVFDVPIPLKDGFLDSCDFILVITADLRTRLQRLQARGLPEEKARQRMAVQLSEQDYASMADALIDNSSTLEDLREHLRAALEPVLTVRGININYDKNE
ncbi:dephospho-CoA kinase [Mageeibacillus indolicus]|uniref:dephospho-CoA kinase n=1 Tax=Mageeibacillus indolicus TaxID=884684 RepID=UPI00068CCD62|nr:dephospho-CoA kinase [Mageeibacillus indolicus]